MNFAEKKQAYNQLQDPAQLEPDRELLAKKAPHAPELQNGIFDKEKSQRETLWALLDVATVEEITANRPAPVKELTKEEMFVIAEQAAKLTNLIHKVTTLEEKDGLVAEIMELIKPIPFKAAEIMLKLPLSIVPDFVKKAEAEKELLAIDLETAKQPVMASLARALSLETPDFKSSTLRPLLKDLRDLNLLKTQSHSDQVIDQMNAEKVELHEKVEELELEKEELQDQLNEVEAEKNDLEEQLEDAEAEKEDLEEQLEEEKKSEATPDQQ